MAKLIFISPYLKGGQDKAKLAHRTKYIATRDGVDLLRSEHGLESATEKQREYILRLVKTFPQSKELAEYEDYLSVHTKDAASDFIDQVWEQFIDSMDKRENYLDYVSHRPGVQSDGDHGLWDKDGKVQNLSKAVEEVANHPGIVWTPVVSLRREDAERLGYTDVDNWRALVNSCAAEIAKGYRMPLEHLRWYAALHEKEKHVHIHMVVFSSDPKEGYLTKEGIRDIKSAFATRVFEQDLLHTYERKTEYRNALGKSAQMRMAELVTSMNSGAAVSERLEQLIGELAEKLKTTKGKKVYGYLPPRVKSVVDEIVDELAKDERVAAAYSLWQDMQDEVVRTYTDDLPERVPLSQQKEFKPVRNMVIRETLKLAEGAVTFDDEGMDDEAVYCEDTDDAPEEGASETMSPPISGIHNIYEQAERYRKAKKALYDENTDMDEKRSAIEMLERLWDEEYTIAAHQLGKVYRDGLGVDADTEKAIEWFKKAAERGELCSAHALGKLMLSTDTPDDGVRWLKYAAGKAYHYSQYTLGKLYLKGEHVSQNVDKGLEYLRASAGRGNQFAQYTLGKLYLKGEHVGQEVDTALKYLRASAEQRNQFAQYTLGKLYLSGKYVTMDVGTALEYLKASAEQENQFAQYTLGKVYLSGEHVSKDVDTALEYLRASAEQGNQYAQYALGKLYLLGQEVPPDRDVAVDYLTLSAEQGNRYAQFFLDRLSDVRTPSVTLAALRMFHHMANILRDTTAQDSTHMGLHIDRKRRRELQEKRIAMGHKPDDHEDENMNLNMR